MNNMNTNTILKIVTICVICTATMMSGCLNESANRTYVGYPLDVEFVGGHYIQYENVVDVEKIHEETGHYTRKITFVDGSWITYSDVVDERITKGLLYNTMSLYFRDGRVEHLDHVTGCETVSRQCAHIDITLTFADGSKKCLHYVVSYRSL